MIFQMDITTNILDHRVGRKTPKTRDNNRIIILIDHNDNFRLIMEDIRQIGF